MKISLDSIFIRLWLILAITVNPVFYWAFGAELLMTVLLTFKDNAEARRKNEG